jgi:5'-nucleotidase
MRFTHLFILLYFLFFFNCKPQKLQLTKIEGHQINVTDTFNSNSVIEDLIKPYREHIDKDLDSTLTYSVNNFSKTDGKFNTALGNYMADLIYEEANPIFKKRTNHNIDMVLINHGGIRASLPKGNISTRHAYELMPFENSIVVVALKGTQVNKLIQYLANSKTAHPISKLKLIINSDYEIIEAKINKKSIVKSKTYYIATSDYLYNGGDNMSFFKPNDSLYRLDYKIRNAIIDNFKKVDTIKPVIDDRFIQIN